jgi:hypothetical protein
MAKRLLILIFFLGLKPIISWSQDSLRDNQLRSLIKQYGQAEVTIPYPGSRAMENLSESVSVASVRGKYVFLNISPRTIEWFISSGYNYDIVKRPDYKGLISAGSVSQAMEWQSYPTYTQYDSIMRHFTTAYPSLCHIDTIGTTVKGKYVLALKISDNAGTDEDEPEVFFSSSIHGDEVAGYVLMLRLADWLLKNYSTDLRARNLVDNLEIWINPLANPDGTYLSGNTITYPVRDNANGYDLNRNFPDPATPYNSFHPEQKETTDMVRFMRKHQFVISANFHSGEEVVNYPWDKWLGKLHADNSWFNSISRAYADTVHRYSGTGYMTFLDNGVTRGAVWYQIYGGRQDFITWELQGREVTIEIDITKDTPAAQLELLWQYNWRSFLGYLENALYGVHGIVQDEDTFHPLRAKVFISGHDVDSSQVYSDTINGRFIRLLYPGTWNLTFSAKGYMDTTVFNVIVLPGQKTELSIKMKAITTEIDTTERDKPLLYPNPVSSILKIKLPENICGTVNVRIINQSGSLMAELRKNYQFGFPGDIDVTGLAAGGYTIIFTNTATGVTYRSRFIVTGK